MEEFDKLQEGLDSGGGKRTSTRHLGGQDSSPDLVGQRAQHLVSPQAKAWDC